MGAIAEVAKAHRRGESALIVSGMDTPDDDTFGCNVGHWNISRLARDVKLGLVGREVELDVLPCLRAHDEIEVDPRKVAAFYKAKVMDDPPLLAVVVRNRAVLVDGHHRIRSMVLHRRPTFRCWLIPSEQELYYRIRFWRHEPGEEPVEVSSAEVERMRLVSEGKL